MAEYIDIDTPIDVAVYQRNRRIQVTIRQILGSNDAKYEPADVRSVVLCRDCVNYVESDEANGEKMCVIDADWCVEDGCYYGFTAYTPPDWFCAGGKKRETEDEKA